MKTIGVLYVCTGRYARFWRDFYLSASLRFFADPSVHVSYFVFTDSPKIAFEHLPEVHRIPLADSPWPGATLLRYHYFLDAETLLNKSDFLYFFNANAHFIRNVAEDILPQPDRPLILVRHPGYRDVDASALPYCRNAASSAFIAPGNGRQYFMGGVNGGRRDDFLQMAAILRARIDRDRTRGILATWHDESHLNRYAYEHEDKLTVLDAEYGYPEGWDLPLVRRIEIRDKGRCGGHAYLRRQESLFRSKIRKILSWL